MEKEESTPLATDAVAEVAVPEETPAETADSSSLTAEQPTVDEPTQSVETTPEPATTDAGEASVEEAIPAAEVEEEEVEEMTGLDLHEEEKPKSYFEDDEEFLKGDDRVLEAQDDAALFQQLDNVVSYNLLNFYSDEGKRRGKYSLRNDPPIFRIEASSGDAAEFVVTRELSEHLAHLFDTVRRGYYGVDAKKKRELTEDGEPRNKISEITHWFESNPRRAAIIVGLLILTVLTAFLI